MTKYRKLQASMNFWWGTDVQHLHILCLQARDKPVIHGTQNSKKPSMQKPGGNRSERFKRDTPICRNFNSTKGCNHPNCNYKHECIVPGCGKNHTVMTHTTEKKYVLRSDPLRDSSYLFGSKSWPMTRIRSFCYMGLQMGLT